MEAAKYSNLIVKFFKSYALLLPYADFFTFVGGVLSLGVSSFFLVDLLVVEDAPLKEALLVSDPKPDFLPI